MSHLIGFIPQFIHLAEVLIAGLVGLKNFLTAATKDTVRKHRIARSFASFLRLPFSLFKIVLFDKTAVASLMNALRIHTDLILLCLHANTHTSYSRLCLPEMTHCTQKVDRPAGRP